MENKLSCNLITEENCCTLLCELLNFKSMFQMVPLYFIVAYEHVCNIREIMGNFDKVGTFKNHKVYFSHLLLPAVPSSMLEKCGFPFLSNYRLYIQTSPRLFSKYFFTAVWHGVF